ncbi:hypothetical protein LE190_04645 [Massilia oculi]|uniref:Uncharacterized protein n=1 Tax=Massilia hydrophila TaxID=3044279 RepID=A0ABS7Y6B0_9BURK|nr:hypothetical protein [Massilia oculi]MCA1855212.1 hypothetical protein [Massilia oculi]
MHTVLEFPAKVFGQWGAIAQEIVPYLVQHGVKRDAIPAILERIRARWDQSAPPAAPRAALSDCDEAARASGQWEEGELYASRHWRSQSARTLIESAMADYLRHGRD